MELKTKNKSKNCSRFIYTLWQFPDKEWDMIFSLTVSHLKFSVESLQSHETLPQWHLSTDSLRGLNKNLLKMINPLLGSRIYLFLKRGMFIFTFVTKTNQTKPQKFLVSDLAKIWYAQFSNIQWISSLSFVWSNWLYAWWSTPLLQEF